MAPTVLRTSSLRLRLVAAALLIAVGSGAVVLSFFSKGLIPDSWRWESGQAKAYAAAVGRFHHLLHEHSGHPERKPDLQAELEQSRAEYERLEQQLQRARQAPGRLAWILRGLGIAFGLIGIGLATHHQMQRSS